IDVHHWGLSAQEHLQRRWFLNYVPDDSACKRCDHFLGYEEIFSDLKIIFYRFLSVIYFLLIRLLRKSNSLASDLI
ncbi:hypothetical protein, partial [Escherichia coli]|uniref:hypothetical protein n=1 Tax=Escherichia coli TaxID=562 RepID=UPI00237AD37B